MSHEDIFEGSRITLFDDAITGHKDGAAVTFHILKGGVPFARVDTKVQNGRCSAQWEAPPVDDRLDSYHLSFHEEIDGRTYKIDRTYTVWPRWVHLEVLRDDDGARFPYFEFRVDNAGDLSQRLSNHQGECRVYLSKPAPVAFAAVAPGNFTVWVNDKGRRRTVKAERRYPAEFVAPVKPSTGDTITQYVNLSTQNHGLDAHGSTVRVTVGAQGDQKRALHERHGRPGDVIYLKAVFNRNTPRSTPACTLAAVEHLETSEAGLLKTATAQVRLGPERTASFLLELGLSGGDTCVLQVGTTKACADATLRFLNYRRIYYQLTYPNDLSKPSLDAMTLGLNQVFVEYKGYDTVTYDELESPKAPKGSWFDGAMVSDDLPARSVNIGDHNRGFFHHKFRDTHHPRGVHLLVCHTQFDGGMGKSQLRTLSSPAIVKTTPKIRFPPGTSGAKVYGVALDASGTGGHVFERAFQDGGVGWRNARWNSGTQSGTIQDDHVHVRWREKRNVVTVKLPLEAVTRIETHNESIRVSIDVYFARGPYNGEADKNRQLIRWRSAKEGGSQGMNGTMLHELGHSMKQTLKNVPPGLSESDHGRKYTGRGHQGPHCAEGVNAAVFNDASKTLRGRSDCACVMFGEGAPSRPIAFCAKCRPFVCAEDLGDITQ